MDMDTCGYAWVWVDIDEYKLMQVDVGRCEWILMDVWGCVCIWISVGQMWVDVGECGLIWVDVDGYEWI